MARKATVRVDDASTRKTTRLNVQVENDAHERLLIHCIKSKKSPGEMVTELINANLREWRVQSNTARLPGGKDRLDSEAQERETAAA